ncbi:MAG: hypothetical protein M1831_001581 [Alyxoria varia]|nr:MAG: hypothetical protein M1831_001581 [Alyxoria varia]
MDPSDAQDATLAASTSSNAHPNPSNTSSRQDPRLSPLESSLLAEYNTLRTQLDSLSAKLAGLASSAPAAIAAASSASSHINRDGKQNVAAEAGAAKGAGKSGEEQPGIDALADNLRALERKTALVCTALKSSVYGIVLQQSIEGFGDGEGGAGGGGYSDEEGEEGEDTVRMG